MEHGEEEESTDKKNNENNNDDTSDTAKTGSITGLSSALDIKNASDELITDSTIDNMSLLSTSFIGVDSSGLFPIDYWPYRRNEENQYPVVSAVSTIVV